MRTVSILHLTHSHLYRMTEGDRYQMANIQMFPSQHLGDIRQLLIHSKNEWKLYYKNVGRIDAVSPEHAFELTQNHNASWLPPNRSSYVGDVFIIDKVHYVVDSFGFIELDLED